MSKHTRNHGGNGLSLLDRFRNISRRLGWDNRRWRLHSWSWIGNLSKSVLELAAVSGRSRLFALAITALSFTQSLYVNIQTKASPTHHIEYRAQIALVPHPPKSLSDKMRARPPESAKKPHLLARITRNARMRYLVVVILHDRQRRGQTQSCHGRFPAQLAIYDKGHILIVLVFFPYVFLRFRRRRKTVHAS